MEAPPGKEALTILRRLIAYSEKLFRFSETVVTGIVDRRLQPRIPTAVIVKSVTVLFWARMGSLNALELTARSSFFHHWLGQSLCSADTIGRVNALMDAEGLRRGIHHIYDRLKRNKASTGKSPSCCCPVRGPAANPYAFCWIMNRNDQEKMKSQPLCAYWRA